MLYQICTHVCMHTYIHTYVCTLVYRRVIRIHSKVFPRDTFSWRVQNRPRGKYSRETLGKYEPLSSKPDKNRRNEVEPNLNVRWRALEASDRRF